eukprot:jgi/Mesen1/4092/ME000214S03275
MSYPNYEADKEKCKEFLAKYRDGADGSSRYMTMLQEIVGRTRRTLDISLQDVLEYDEDESLVERIRSNARRYTALFAEAVDELLPEAIPTEPSQDQEEDAYDVLMRQRLEDDQAATESSSDPRRQLPPELRRRYELRIQPGGKQKLHAVREVAAAQLGHLVVVKGIITRCSDVKPLLQVATYSCGECGYEIFQEVTGRNFMPLHECPSTRCSTNQNRGKLHLHTRGSKFLKFQEARIQELAEQVPKGHIPRSMSVHIRGELTRQVSPGDEVAIAGVFLPMPHVGFRAMRAGLTADTFLEATSITHFKKRYQERAESVGVQEQLQQLAEDGDVYTKLARSIAPEIYGHEDIKKALLLLLVGAPTRELKDGMKIRGDLHVCLMGDPGVAKSQLLKHIVSIAPRGIYTTGRGSSGVGLTAAVHRDPVTNEMLLEGGALVLADMGICAIDEFDKMEEADRTAIHEVMEQQTVSIAKAGITTSLNARTAVLSAANPAWGRYDLRRTPAENINLPPALLSRFDLMWLILDKADMESDVALARHVLHVHQHSAPPALQFEPLTPSLLRSYVAAARSYTPFVPRDLTDYMASAYAAMRQEEAKSNAPHSYTTARTLLSIIRISEALARLRFSDTVAQSDVDEALRLMQMSKFSLYADDRRQSGLDPISDIYSIIRDEAARASTVEVTFEDARNWINKKGHSEAQLRQCLEEYASLNVWQIDPISYAIHFIDA